MSRLPPTHFQKHITLTLAKPPPALNQFPPTSMKIFSLTVREQQKILKMPTTSLQKHRSAEYIYPAHNIQIYPVDIGRPSSSNIALKAIFVCTNS